LGVWPTGGGWLSTHLWEHYLFTQNKDFLNDVYPTMKSAAEFLLAILVEEPVSGKKYLVTAPSASPENTHGGYNVCFAPTMDNQIIRDAFNYVIEASKVLGVDNELRIQLEAAVKRLPPDQIGKHSQLQEWFFDWDDPRSDHRHVSHLYGLFPSAQISVDETPNFAEAAKQTLIQRGDLATGWSLAWKINLWARLQDGDHAYNLVRLLLTPDRPTIIYLMLILHFKLMETLVPFLELMKCYYKVKAEKFVFFLRCLQNGLQETLLVYVPVVAWSLILLHGKMENLLI
jgi:alpha-L-fucosidase 2